jgi:rubrerythrin
MGKDVSQSLKMLATALEMEDKGRAFYEKAAAACANDLGRGIFRMLAEDEKLHQERIRKIHGQLQGGKAWPSEWQQVGQPHDEMPRMFHAFAEKHGARVTAAAGDIEALETGISLEAASIRFYREALAKAEERQAREFLERMVAEEIVHRNTLTDMKFYLSDPAGWFRETEGGGLDGA